MPVSYMEINLNALRHNLKVIRAYLPKEVNVLAVVKANAYGHGAKETLRIALEEGYVAAAVARVEEGAARRRIHLPDLCTGTAAAGGYAYRCEQRPHHADR